MSDSPRVFIGLILYGDSTARYLPFLMPALKDLEYGNYELMFADNTENRDNPNSKFLQTYHPDVACEWMGGNTGFAAAYNKMIRLASRKKADFFLALNVDVLPDRYFLGEMVSMLKDQKAASASPKILKWDFSAQKKTNLIDSCGIVLKPGLRFIDLGQGKPDDNQYDRSRILGPSGAAALYRMSALEKVRHQGEYFDESFFMYKEDADLAYRLFLAGFRSKLVSGALIYHDRTAYGSGEGSLGIAAARKNKSRFVKIHSFRGQQIIFSKYWSRQNIWNKLAILWFQIRALLFALAFEPYLLPEFKYFKIIKKKYE